MVQIVPNKCITVNVGKSLARTIVPAALEHGETNAGFCRIAIIQRLESLGQPPGNLERTPPQPVRIARTFEPFLPPGSTPARLVTPQKARPDEPRKRRFMSDW
jgi:hypothetical protein